MRKLDWYIIRKFLSSFFIAIALIIIVVVVFDISEKLDKFIEKEAPLHAIIFDYYLNFLPYFVNMFSSLFIFISVIFFTTRMAQNTEILPILCSGISYRRLMVPYIFCAVLIGTLNLLLANFVIPDVNKARLDFERIYVRRPYQNTLSNIHLQYDSTTYYYVESFDNATLSGHKFSCEIIADNQLSYKLSAQNVRFDTATQVWRLLEYTERTLTPEGEIFNKGNFREETFPIRPIDFSAGLVRPDEMNFKQLNQAIKREKFRGGTMVSRLQFERLQRFLHPLSAIILTLIGLCLSSNKTRRAMGRNLAVGIALAFTFILFLQLSNSMASSNASSVWIAAFMPIFIYGLIALGLIKYAQK